jgi:hypothetical protein
MESIPEVWLRGPLPGIQPYLQPAARTLQQVWEDIEPVVLGLIFHAAEHSSRHARQIVTLAKIARG